MSQNVCPQCGAPIEAGALECKYCGEKLVPQQVNQQIQQPSQQQYAQQQPTVIIQQVPQPTVVMQQVPQPQIVHNPAINTEWPVRSKVTAGILAIFLGGLGVHKFYMGKIGMGIFYLCFCWTYIPAIAGIGEGIMYLCSNDEDFQIKNHVRIG